MKNNIMLIYLISLVHLFVFSSCNPKPEPETYLLPKNFTGRVTVIFNQQNGSGKKYENGRRVYEIPSNGILLTQFAAEYGWINHEYYYIDSSGEKTSLPIYKHEYNEDGTTKWIVNDKNAIGIFFDGTTGQYAKDDIAPFQFFTVSSQSGLTAVETNDAFNKRINTLIGTNL